MMESKVVNVKRIIVDRELKNVTIKTTSSSEFERIKANMNLLIELRGYATVEDLIDFCDGPKGTKRIDNYIWTKSFRFERVKYSNEDYNGNYNMYLYATTNSYDILEEEHKMDTILGWRSDRYPWMQQNQPQTLVKINKVVTHNERVVIVRFDDDTFTKAVCSPNDKFDLDVGIQICILKKLFGDADYHKLIRNIHKMIDRQEKEKLQSLEEKKERRKKQQEREEKNRKAEKAESEQFINEIAEAVRRGLNKADEEKRDESIK